MFSLSIEKNLYILKSKKTFFRSLTALILIVIFICSLYGYNKPLPEGISFEGELRRGEVEFLSDLTYRKANDTVLEQVILNRILSMIKTAEEFIILDMFLFNDDYERTNQYPKISAVLVDALIEKKKQNPTIKIIVLTDPINSFYGSYSPKHLHRLEKAGVPLVYTDLTSLRDPNPVYSGFWRAVLQWFRSPEEGWLPNPFSPDSPMVTLRSYLELINFKANHRKVIITEKEAIVTSLNPHDASAFHSNIAFVVKGKEIIEDLIETEKAVAELSGFDSDVFNTLAVEATSRQENIETGLNIRVLTEGKIKQHLIQEIRDTKANNLINMGVFYLSDRDIIKELLKAAERDVEIRIILDANKDAFGREKNGISNRPVAYELKKKSKEKIKIKWYNTNGEQFHSKLVMIEKDKETVLLGGSANLTKRNIGDFNLESNIKVTGNHDMEIMKEARDYFEKLWFNQGGIYTLEYDVYRDESLFSYLLYRFQEWSGICTF
ncbi:MAG: phospholipase [Clostridia bacterium]|nr:phospholipase [Clostridia bacterium]